MASSTAVKTRTCPTAPTRAYPARTGIAVAAASTTDWLLQYLDDQGVNDTNVAFYLGTHAHSDHIANADDIIYKYRPKAILSPEYSDEWITDDNSLWDNQYVYDRLVTAANWAVDSYGATSFSAWTATTRTLRSAGPTSR